MELMTKDKEAEVINSVVEAIKMANSGTDPSEAIAKIASARDYTPDIVQRMVEAFNVSRTHRHMKDTLGEKRAASFPLADTRTVSKYMYPEKVETPADKAASEWIPAEGLEPETHFYATTEPIILTPMEIKGKAVPKNASSTNVDGAILLERVLKEQAKLANVVSVYESKLASARLKIMDGIIKLASRFDTLYHEPFSSVRASAIKEFGNDVVPLFDVVYEVSRAKNFGEAKSASIEKPASLRSDIRSDIEKTLIVRREYAETVEKYAAACKELDAFRKEASKSLAMLKSAMNPAMVAGFGAGVSSRVANKMLPPELGDKFEAEDLMSPDVEQTRRNIQARLLVRNLIKSDEVLSKAKPQRVVDSFNELVSMTPQLLDNPMVLRAALRRSVESSGLDIADAMTLVDLRRRLAEAETVSPGVPVQSASPLFTVLPSTH